MEMQQEIDNSSQCGFDVLFADGLVGVMAKAAGGANEEHCRGYVRAEDHGVMAGAGEHGLRGKAGAARGLVQMLYKRVIHGHGFLLGLQARMHANTAQRSSSFGLGKQVCDRGMAGFVARMTYIERGVHLARNDVGGAGERIDVADGRDELRVA